MPKEFTITIEDRKHTAYFRLLPPDYNKLTWTLERRWPYFFGLFRGDWMDVLWSPHSHRYPSTAPVVTEPWDDARALEWAKAEAAKMVEAEVHQRRAVEFTLPMGD